jgi:hypothetical protein
MKNWLLLINLGFMLILLGSSCNKKTQKTQVPQNQVQEERDTLKNQEIHTPKSDDRIEINKKKQEQTERKQQQNHNNTPSEEKTK